MLVPRTSSAFVCLRCELHRARRRLPTYARQTPRAQFSASPRRRDGADELEAQLEAPLTQLKIIREKPPWDRYRRRKGKVIHEKSAKLAGIKSLGDDAEILVLKEVRDAPTPKEEPVDVARAEPLEVPDMVALQQDSKLTREEVWERLDILRPQDRPEPNKPHHVTQATYIKLIRDLTQGFTQQQLSQFYSVTKKVGEGQIYKDMVGSFKGDASSAKQLTTRTEWQPGTTPISRRLPGINITTQPKRGPVSKQLLVDRILRVIWNLVPLEEVEAPGEIELSLKPWQLTLLNAGDEPLLDKIGRLRKAKLEIHWAHSVLRITADKTTAEYAADDVAEALKTTAVKKLLLKPWAPCLERENIPQHQNLATVFTQEDLDLVTSLTRTSTQRIDSTSTLVIRGLDEHGVTEAERMLIRLLPLKNHISHSIDQGHDASSSRALLPTFQDSSLFDYKYRNSRLGRWSLPLTGRSNIPNTPGQEPVMDRSTQSQAGDEEMIKRALSNLRQSVDKIVPSQELPERKAIGNWTATPTYKFSAEFGQALFPLEQTTPDNTNAASALPTPSTFLPSFPGLSTLLASDLQTEQANVRPDVPALLYSFIPAPEQQNLAAGQALPDLHVEIHTSRKGGSAILKNLSLGVQERIHDVLLQDKSADVRFFRHGRLRLQKTNRDKHIKEWMDVVTKNIESGERLTAPDLQIDIPKWTIPGSPATAKGTRSVKYLFSGIQIRQAVSGSYDGAPMSYSTVQSNKLGAKGGALHMYHNDVSSKEGDAGLEAFVQKCFHMVDSITEAAARSQPLSKQMRPRHEDSGRKMRRQEQRGAAARKRLGSQNDELVESGIAGDTVMEKEGGGEGEEALGLQQLSDEPDPNDSILHDDARNTSSSSIMHTASKNKNDPHTSSALSLNEPENSAHEMQTQTPREEEELEDAVKAGKASM